MQIVMVGSGYVGLVSGVCLAEVGHTVTCVDKDAAKIDRLREGVSPIFEPGLETMLKRNIRHERLLFSTSLKDVIGDADCVFIAVGTPQGEDGSADLQYVLAVAREIGATMTRDMLVVVKSTVPVGTCDAVESAVRGELKKRGGNFHAVVASNPEFLKEGAAIEDFMRPERIVCGTVDERSVELLREIYRPFILDDPGKLYFMERRSSELTKYAANSMLAVRISFMNELSRLCEILGANIDHVRRGIGADQRIGRKFLYAGPGFGGSCFPKDIKALIRTAAKCGLDLKVVKAADEANAAQKQHSVQKVLRHFGSLKGKRIGVWGLAFKPGTDDVRESPARTIIESLLNEGAEVVAHDPEAIHTFKNDIGDRPGLRYAEHSYDAVRDADAVVLVTEWSEYRRPNWKKMKSLMRHHVIFDLRNQYVYDNVKEHNFKYYCIGRPDDSTAAVELH